MSLEMTSVSVDSLTQIDSEASTSVTTEETDYTDASKIDIAINNVVCKFDCGCSLNLRDIALNGANVEYKCKANMLFMKLKHPYATARFAASGRVICAGTTSNGYAKLAARCFVKRLVALGYKASVNQFKIINVFGSCSLPFGVKIPDFSKAHSEARYEPELQLGLTFSVKKPKATLKIFSTGSITVITTRIASVRAAIEAVYPKVLPFRREFGPGEGLKKKREPRQRRLGPRKGNKKGKKTGKKEATTQIGLK